MAVVIDEAGGKRGVGGIQSEGIGKIRKMCGKSEAEV